MPRHVSPLAAHLNLTIHFLSGRAVRASIVWRELVKHYPISRDDPGRRGPSSPARQSPLHFSFVLVFLHRLPTFLRHRFISFIGHNSGVTELYGQICYGTGNQMKWYFRRVTANKLHYLLSCLRGLTLEKSNIMP